MTEYINKAELYDRACDERCKLCDTQICEYLYGMPTVDIVRCGECKHIDKTICLTSFPEKFICKIDNKSHTVDWFCADGERK